MFEIPYQRGGVERISRREAWGRGYVEAAGGLLLPTSPPLPSLGSGRSFLFTVIGREGFYSAQTSQRAWEESLLSAVPACGKTIQTARPGSPPVLPLSANGKQQGKRESTLYTSLPFLATCFLPEICPGVGEGGPILGWVVYSMGVNSLISKTTKILALGLSDFVI